MWLHVLCSSEVWTVGVRSTVDSDGTTWFCIGINPEQWRVGPLSVGRRGGKLYPIAGRDQQLAAYQEAVREELGDRFELLTGPMRIRFYFWRQTEAYEREGKKLRRNEVDATNLQKALEDALQGVLFENDRDTRDIRSVIVEQGQDVIGKILFSIEPLDEPHTIGIPDECLDIVMDTDADLTKPQLSDNSWPPRG